MSTNPAPYFSVACVKVKPDKIGKAVACFEEIVTATKENEPGAVMYRYSRNKGANVFVWISKFVSYEAYKEHMNSAHVHAWLEKYPDDPRQSDIYGEDWEFCDQDEEFNGGFERV